jgi:hypothetical protein
MEDMKVIGAFLGQPGARRRAFSLADRGGKERYLRGH